MQGIQTTAISLTNVIVIVTLSSCMTIPQTGISQVSQLELLENLDGVEPEWEELLRKTPLSYLTPVPDTFETSIDGLYVKIDPAAPQAWLCRRCADYRLAGGLWRLQMDRGVMRIYYEVTGWKSLASYHISGDRLFVFNDPYCPDEIGEYSWDFQDGNLLLVVITDGCSIGLRGVNFSKQLWQSCDAFDKKPIGCSKLEVEELSTRTLSPGVSVFVHEGDSRFFEKPPDVMINANAEDLGITEGFELSSSSNSIPYGLNRILWWGGDWIEVATEESFHALGVQFLGDPQIGWARVLLDEVEVWRGNTADIWSQYGRHGGYIEILPPRPGPHRIRVESLGFDYRPVTVASFGFSYQTGVVVAESPPIKEE